MHKLYQFLTPWSQIISVLLLNILLINSVVIGKIFPTLLQPINFKKISLSSIVPILFLYLIYTNYRFLLCKAYKSKKEFPMVLKG